MSHRELLMKRLNDAIEAGEYRAAGTPRTPSDEVADKPVAEASPRIEPEKVIATSPEQKRGTPDPQSYVQGLAARRRDAVGDSVHAALNAKFKK